MFSAQKVLAMKKEFNEKLQRLISRKKPDNINFLDEAKYQDIVDEVKAIKDKHSKTYHEFNMLENFDYIEINGRYRLIKPKDANNSTKYYIRFDELFGVLHTMHLLHSHDVLNELSVHIKERYCNISKEVIKIYLSCCQVCKNR